LQTVLGFEAADIARTFMMSPTAIAQRLVRAKKKIRDARVPFDVPPLEELSKRKDAVLEAIYGAYALDWMNDDSARSLSGEALYLAQLMASLLPDPEALGLAALLGFADARKRARVVDGVFVPIHLQDRSLWDRELMRQAAAALAQAAAIGRLGRFQLEAAIQQAHGNWPVMLQLLHGLCALWPTTGAFVSRAAAVGEVHGADAGLAALDAIVDDIRAFQPAHATRAHLLQKAGRTAEAAAAYAQALSLTTSTPVRRFLSAQARVVSG
jgi:predicted RNA polymerase sigma factor